MKLLLKRWSLIALLLGVGLALLLGGGGSQAQEEEATPLVAGDIVDPQDQPVEGAEVTLLTGPQDTVVAETT
ncbi:MAG: hypothetical protein PVF47_09505, partial [Anaerolineae bacterium]